MVIYFLVKPNKHEENDAEIEYCFYGKSEYGSLKGYNGV